mmetsp:Transcript_31922/g.42564  ORF Transcript_31922/g.42564 Transcript_31922/m.42564 type:complete len:105 (-) Transcript_31922:151-465(-)
MPCDEMQVKIMHFFIASTKSQVRFPLVVTSPYNYGRMMHNAKSKKEVALIKKLVKRESRCTFIFHLSPYHFEYNDARAHNEIFKKKMREKTKDEIFYELKFGRY